VIPVAGLISHDPAPERRSAVDRMLRACGADAASAKLAEAGDATIGARRGSLVADRQRLVAVDGQIYDGDGHVRIGAREELPEAVARVNGDFGAAVYDATTRVLHLARDRLGVRPMYYAQTPLGFAFCSRLQGILAVDKVSREPSREFVGLFAGGHYRYFDNDLQRSPYEAVRQLPAGHHLRWHDGHVLVRRYWGLEEGQEPVEPEARLAEAYRELLLDAVRRRLDGAARPAFTLSGGMDSSSVLACAVAITGRRADALSAVYDDEAFDESDDIRMILADTVETWHAVRVDGADCFDLIGDIIRAQGEPISTVTWLSHYLICARAAEAGHDVLVGGLGGDELNAGEYEHFLYHFADLRAAGDERAHAHEVKQWAAHHDHPIFRKSAAVAAREIDRLTDPGRPGRCLVDKRRLGRYAVALEPGFFDLAAFEPAMDHPFSSYLKNRTAQDLLRETIPPCLRATCQQCAAFGLEPRLPFLDHRLVEFMFRVPGRCKIRDGVSKVLLRKAMRGIVPEAARTRITKTGWNAPAHAWFAGPWREPLADLIHSRAFRERGIYDPKEVRRLFDEHQRIVTERAPIENHMMFFWQLVNLELWLRDLERTAPGPEPALAVGRTRTDAANKKSVLKLLK
jgi:asparagine synthase (glutamine-hydrolysing)